MNANYRSVALIILFTLLRTNSCLGQIASLTSGTRQIFEDIKTTSASTYVSSRDALRNAFKKKGDLGKVYESQLELMMDGKAVPDQLLVKLKEDKKVKKPLVSVLFSRLLDLVERRALMTGNERAAAHIASFKEFSEMAVMGAQEMVDMLKTHGIKGMKSLYYGVQSGVNVMAVEEGHNITDMWMKLLEVEEVEFVEPNLLVELSSSSSNCPAASEWGLFHSNTDSVMNLVTSTDAHNSSKSEVIVAIIDSGIDIDHKSLRNRIWTNEAERTGEPGVDDDENGFIDDVYGWNFADNNPDVMDLVSHGTHVAGIIGADQSVAPRFQGQAPNAKLLPCKFVSRSSGGSISNAIQCLEYAWLMGADIISNSWGSMGAYSLSMRDALMQAEESGILTVASAGNDGNDNDPEVRRAVYPASFNLDSVLSVAAVDEEGRLYTISNYGNKSVDIGAPGVGITSTLPNNKFGEMSGTSMAAPFVSGAAALILGLCRDQGKTCTSLDVKDALLSSADSSDHLTGLVKTSGHLNTLGAAQKLGLLSNEEYLAHSMPLHQDCANSSQERKVSIFQMELLVGLLFIFL